MSKIIKLNNDFKVDRTKEKDAPSEIELTLGWLKYAVQTGFKQGLQSDKRRLFFTISEKMDKCIEDKTETLELNEIEYVFMCEAVNKAVVDANQTIPFTIAEKALLEASNK
jgi:hypothetical protein